MEGTQGFLAQIRQRPHDSSVHVAKILATSSFAAAQQHRQQLGTALVKLNALLLTGRAINRHASRPLHMQHA